MAANSLKSRQLKAERWARRQAEARTNRDRAVVLVDMARAYVGPDDEMWADLTRFLHGKLSGRISS